MSDDIILDDEYDEDGYPIPTDDRVTYVDEWGHMNSYSPSEERARRNRPGPCFTLVGVVKYDEDGYPIEDMS